MDIDNGIEIFQQGNEHYYIGNADTVTQGYDFIISLHRSVALERHHLGIIMDVSSSSSSSSSSSKKKNLSNQLSIIQWFSKTIRGSRKQKKMVLVQCFQGKERAPFILIFLMKYYGLINTFNDGLDHLKKKLEPTNHQISLNSRDHSNWSSTINNMESKKKKKKKRRISLNIKKKKKGKIKTNKSFKNL